MKTWIFKLYDVKNKTTYVLKYPVDEWRAFGISYGREEKTSIIKSYSASFTFIKEDADYLKDIVLTKGFNEKIRIDAYKMTAFGEVKEYSGFLELFDSEMSGNTFKCPIYSGGFFTLLDNVWNDEIEIKNDYYDSFNKFQDIKFKGGEYEYQENLGLLKENQNKGVVSVDMKLGMNFQTYLPVGKTTESNSKLTFFNQATAKTIQGNAEDVTKEQCFIVSSDKTNGGVLRFEMNNIGDLKIKGVPYRHPNNNSYRIDPASSNHSLQIKIVFYLYNDTGDDVWRPLQNRLGSDPSFERTIIIRSKMGYDNMQGQKVDVTFSKVSLGTFTQTISGYLQQELDKGYMVAVSMSVQSCVLEYLDWSDNTVMSLSVGSQNIYNNGVEFYPGNEFIIRYKTNAFKVNGEKTVHGMKVIDVFDKLMENINSKEVLIGGQISIVNKYTLSVGRRNLINETNNYMLASGTTLLGSRLQIEESDIDSSIITSFGKFIEFIYKVFGLKFVVVYDKKNDWYDVSFQKIEDCYNNTKIQDLEHVNNITVKVNSETQYTNIKVGYENKNDVIFGQLEFNTVNNFKTGNTETDNKELDLVSPYLAGAMDIETFIYENHGNFEDTKDGSNDIYVLEVENFETVVYSITQNKIKKTINVSLTPKRILSKHDNELASCFWLLRKLLFISSQKNGNFSYGGIAENSEYTLVSDGYAKPFLIEISVPAVYDMIENIDNNPFGYFQFSISGKTYKGYIAENSESLIVNPMNEQESVLLLLAHRDSDL